MIIKNINKTSIVFRLKIRALQFFLLIMNDQIDDIRIFFDFSKVYSQYNNSIFEFYIHVYQIVNIFIIIINNALI